MNTAVFILIGHLIISTFLFSVYRDLLFSVYRDKRTPSPFYPLTPNDDGEATLAVKPDHVYMDCMGFGMGCSCLQVELNEVF